MPDARFNCGAQYDDTSALALHVVTLLAASDSYVAFAFDPGLPKKSCTIASPGLPGYTIGSSGNVCEYVHCTANEAAACAPPALANNTIPITNFSFTSDSCHKN